MEIFGFKNRPITDKERKPSGNCKVEKAGYMSAEKRIKQLIQAGRRLAESRINQFDSDDNTEPVIDPTRKPGIDFAEISEMKRQSDNSIKQAKKRLQDASKLVQDARKPATPVVETSEKKPSEKDGKAIVTP